jgi:hypothetical protein
MAAAKANVKVGINVLDIVNCESEVQKKKYQEKQLSETQ